MSSRQISEDSDAGEALKKSLANVPDDHVMVTLALEFARATRRARLAEVAALERFERALLMKIRGASPAAKT
jgi:hypothetical protein